MNKKIVTKFTPINMYDPIRNYKKHEKEYQNAINKVFNHGKFINGPEVAELEKVLSNYVGTKYCITVANGTDALQIALMSLNVGINDEVITVSHTWISTAEVISIINAKPVFVDIEDKLFCIDSTKIERAITKKTKAIIIVSIYGQIPNVDKINEIAHKYNLPVIEDGAQSFGAMYKGKKSGSLTTIGTTSFFPSKPLGCYGDGGACFTDNADLAIKIRSIKNHGCLKRFQHNYIGMNSRLDTIQAAILLVKIKYLNNVLEKRNDVAKYYTKKLLPLEKKGLIKLPKIGNDNYHVWAQYSILLNSKKRRDKIYEKLKENGINVSIYYPKPLHTQECFKYLNYEDTDLPIAKEVSEVIINLPCYEEIQNNELDLVCKKFIDIVMM